jgi:hypothetical protein
LATLTKPLSTVNSSKNANHTSHDRYQPDTNPGKGLLAAVALQQEQSVPEGIVLRQILVETILMSDYVAADLLQLL